MSPTDSIMVRPEFAADHETIRRVVAAAFGSDVEADLVDRIRASDAYIPEMALVAEVEGVVAGHVMISRAVVRNELGDAPIAMLSPLAVAPDSQRLGVGSELVRAALAIADSRGEPFVVLEGSPQYYARFGFEHSVIHGVHIHLPDWAPAEAAQLVRLSAFDPTDGLRRGTVVYPSPFDQLE